MTRLITTTILALGLFASPALAGDSPADTAKQKPAVESPRKERQRQTTLERWRGGPRHSRAANEVLRAQALDKMLPPANRAFNGGASLAGF